MDTQIFSLVLIGVTVLSVIVATVLVMWNYRDKKRDTLNHLNDLIADAEKTLKAMRDRCDEYNRMNKFLDDRPTLEAEEKQLIGSIAEKESEIRRRQNEITMMEEQIETLKKDGESLQQKVDMVKALESDIDALKHDKAELEDEKKRANEDIKEAKKTLGNLHGEQSSLLAEHKQIKLDIAGKESQFKELADKVKEMENELKDKYEKLNFDVKALAEIERDILDGKQVLEGKKETKDNIEKEIEKLSDVRLKFQQEQARLLAEQKQVMLDVAEKESQFKALADQLKKVETDLTKIENKLKDKQAKLDLDVKALAEIEKDIVDGGHARDALKTENAKLTNDNKGLAKNNQDLVKSNADLEPKVKKLETRKSEAEEWLKANAPKLAHMDDLEREIAQRKEEYETVGKRIEAAHKDLAETMKMVKEGIERLTKMNLSGVQTLRLSSFEGLKNGEGAFSVSDPKNCAEAFGDSDESRALQRVAKHFVDCGFEVPDRLLKAFHTSLKTSDMSSLTVMAGVSGTGKSAIPKLYAEAMGIFFSPLAVEPRWDSPKDLMGFFNYVTNRYEPTPLARAMFQFQGLWEDDFKPGNPLDKFMFMPMLDEMNLARIEYYFSEFLSKLEMRRLVASDGNLQKKDIPAIGLEIFSGCDKTIDGKQVKEHPLHLFANTNTLFVGTMNEDETTQSLSDKVIDRANVLYFGKPKKLQSPEKNEERLASFNPGSPLKYETWHKWCKTVDEDALTSAIEALTKLNDQLAEFNRPFAHRTFQAMLSYIANYPSTGDANRCLKHALADQIGMRIMPKLRGLDLRQCAGTFEEIEGIIHTHTNDQVLLNAFENAYKPEKNKSGFFRWNGFDWSEGAAEA